MIRNWKSIGGINWAPLVTLIHFISFTTSYDSINCFSLRIFISIGIISAFAISAEECLRFRDRKGDEERNRVGRLGKIDPGLVFFLWLSHFGMSSTCLLSQIWNIRCFSFCPLLLLPLLSDIPHHKMWSPEEERCISLGPEMKKKSRSSGPVRLFKINVQERLQNGSCIC